MAFALDLDSSTKKLTYYQNGSEVGYSTFSYGGTVPVFPYFRMNTGCTGTANFGNGYFGTTATFHTDSHTEIIQQYLQILEMVILLLEV